MNTFDQAKNYLEKDLSPIGDMRASKEYRLEIAKNLLMKCFVEINSNKLSRVN
jgi:xanthine dehydrogenase small subunit